MADSPAFVLDACALLRVAQAEQAWMRSSSDCG
jgi:hypothetical protein